MTGYAEKAAEEAPDIEAIIKGFNVESRTAAPSSPTAMHPAKRVSPRMPFGELAALG